MLKKALKKMQSRIDNIMTHYFHKWILSTKFKFNPIMGGEQYSQLSINANSNVDDLLKQMNRV